MERMAKAAARLSAPHAASLPLTGQACHIVNIRQARKVPGLRRQHLIATQALGEFWDAARQFLCELASPACLDRHMADQVLPNMALADGKSRVSVTGITDHCRTNMWAIEKFARGKFEIEVSTILWVPQK
jgi:RNA 3'-terminal phosphate cyclase